MDCSYDSESEDCPRVILDVTADFVLHNRDPDAEPVIIKLINHRAMVKNPTTGETVPLTGLRGICALRPIPSPDSVSRVRQLMGSGENGVWTGTKFEPPLDSNNADLPPDEVFRLREVNRTNRESPTMNRFCIRRRFVPAVSNLNTMCIFTGGACFNSGPSAIPPKAGVALVFKDGDVGKVGFALESKGVDGNVYAHTNSRAELRSVIAALKYRTWWGEGWKRVVIVTHSEYVGSHATSWLRNWAAQDWRLSSGKSVANRDLWQELSTVMGAYAQSGCEISFWMVPRRMNTVAARVAKNAAEEGGGSETYTNIRGFLI